MATRRTHWVGLGACLLAVASLVATACGQTAPAPAQGAETLILGTSSFWRHYYALKQPVVRKGAGTEGIELKGWGSTQAKWLNMETPLPPGDWAKPDFADAGWYRQPLVDPNAPWVALVCLRGKFEVTDPGNAEGLRLSVDYRGGIAAYLNGSEIARGHLQRDAKLEDLADDYPEGELHAPRTLDAAVPAALLRKGVNVLAIEVHRSAYPPSAIKAVGNNETIDGGTCGVVKVRLTAPNGSAVRQNVTRPKGLQVWNSDPMASDSVVDHGEANEPLRPIALVAARNGVASGKVVVGSDKAIKGLTAAAGELRQIRGAGRIPASAIEVRYALPGVPEAGANWTYTVAPERFDVLAQVPPAEIPVRAAQQLWRGRKLPDEPPIAFGAVQPVWVTVHVPANAPPADYSGTLTITIPDEKPIVVTTNLKVCAWALPDSKEFRTFVDFVESPETLAMCYDAPLWSDRHFELIAQSLKLLGEAGNKVCYIPLIADTNQGNDETMVRWIRKPDGTCRYDFTVMDRYLDAVEKFEGKPEVVCFYVWDTYLEGGIGGDMRFEGEEVKKERLEYYGRGPLVSFLDEATGKIEKGELPSCTDPKSRGLWEPLMREVRERMKKRGLEGAMMIGIATDHEPVKEIVEFFKQVAPDVPWLNQAHPLRAEIQGVPVGYSCSVQGKFPLDPSVGRSYGWKNPHIVAQFPRDIRDDFPPTPWRFMGEMNIAGEQRGFGRLGGDLWPVLKDKRGRTVGPLSSRFPKTSWRALNINTCLLAPGPNGAIATVRFEMLREGLQECEARIFLENALTDTKLRATLGDALAAQAQGVLDERTRDMRRAVSTLQAETVYWTAYAYISGTWYMTPGIVGSHWFVGSDWQTRTGKLYETADEVGRKLTGK